METGIKQLDFFQELKNISHAQINQYMQSFETCISCSEVYHPDAHDTGEENQWDKTYFICPTCKESAGIKTNKLANEYMKGV